MSLRSVMTPDPMALEISRSVGEAIALLDDKEVRHLPILQQGVLVGIVSDRDLAPIRKAMLDAEGWNEANLRRILEEEPLEDVVNKQVIFVDVESALEMVIDLLLEHRIGALPVTEGGALVGIVTATDLLKELRGRLD